MASFLATLYFQGYVPAFFCVACLFVSSAFHMFSCFLFSLVLFPLRYVLQYIYIYRQLLIHIYAVCSYKYSKVSSVTYVYLYILFGWHIPALVIISFDIFFHIIISCLSHFLLFTFSFSVQCLILYGRESPSLVSIYSKVGPGMLYYIRYSYTK